MKKNNKQKRKTKIKDNPSFIELIKPIEGLHKIINNPFIKFAFPNLKLYEFEDEIKKIHQEANELTNLPDKFNDIFENTGWFITNSMSIDIVKEALSVATLKNIDEAENFLANSINEAYLNRLFLKIRWRQIFDKRMRLFELVKVDYLEERYHACIPLLLSLIDGLVDELTKHVGIFSENVDVTAFDSLSGHETGLQSISKILRSPRKKVNEDSITIPYRNGILHGKELSFDNKIVAAKCWHLLSAIVDWHNDIKFPKEKKEEKTLHEVFSEHLEHKKKMLDFEERFANYSARDFSQIYNFPILDTQVEVILRNSPEEIVVLFLEYMKNHKFGMITPLLFQFEEQKMKERTSQIAKDFKNIEINSYKIINIEDTAPAMSKVDIEINFIQHMNIVKTLSFYLSFVDKNGKPLVRDTPDGLWIISSSILIHLQ
ncbi:hypothetical protein [Aliarcobacter butzleri]|uniref:hypothetical protein n=1 Tax=Aliarcobacter butzleri TaxID=28197 RepID=UPI001919EA89|nr:hypothetical protein [Aliarcobacter butzleri]